MRLPVPVRGRYGAQRLGRPRYRRRRTPRPLLPDDAAEGTISTLPLAWRTDFDPVRGAADRRDTALEALRTLAVRLDALEELTGRSIRIGLEPEPGCLIETTTDAIGPVTALRRDPSAAGRHPRIGLCLDTCHLATSFEDPHEALAALHRAAVPIVKSQLSAALHAVHPGHTAVRTALGAFAEPRFLHQTRTRDPQGALLATDDLDEALAEDSGLPTNRPWRAHFHVPLHAPPQPPLTSTMAVLRDTLALLVGGPAPRTHHLEVETYTWQALPPELRPRTRGRLIDGIAAELALARDLLTDLGLKELP